MKKLLLLSLLFIGVITNAQEAFIYNKEGLKPDFIVIDIPNKTQSELYISTINWIKDTYKNPDEVIRSTIENNKVRLEGIKPNSLCVKTLGSTTCNNAKYEIEIEFKDGRLRFLPNSLETYFPPSNVAFAVVGWSPVDLNNGEFYFNKKSEPKKITELQIPIFSSIFNDLAKDLKNYIEKGKDNTVNSDW